VEDIDPKDVELHEGPVLSDAAWSTAETLGRSSPILPSPDIVQTHIDELEASLRNIDFRLQQLYYQRTGLIGNLSDAQAHLKSSQK
jgi:hypothetical protein